MLNQTYYFAGMQHSVSFVIKNLIFVTHFLLLHLHSAYEFIYHILLSNIVAKWLWTRTWLHSLYFICQCSSTLKQDTRMLYPTLTRFFFYWFLFKLSFGFYTTNTIKWSWLVYLQTLIVYFFSFNPFPIQMQ